MVATVKSNLGQLLRLLDDLPNALNLNRGGNADELFNALAPRIHARFISQRGPRGRFKQNRGWYGTKKRAYGIPVGIGMKKGGRQSGDMARLANFLGQRMVKELEATLAFGVTDFARRKGMWFHNGAVGGDGNTERSAAIGQPERNFFEMNQGDVGKMLDVIADQLVAYILGF